MLLITRVSCTCCQLQCSSAARFYGTIGSKLLSSSLAAADRAPSQVSAGATVRGVPRACATWLRLSWERHNIADRSLCSSVLDPAPGWLSLRLCTCFQPAADAAVRASQSRTAKTKQTTASSVTPSSSPRRRRLPPRPPSTRARRRRSQRRVGLSRGEKALPCLVLLALPRCCVWLDAVCGEHTVHVLSAVGQRLLACLFAQP